MSKKNKLDQYYTSQEAVDIAYDVIAKHWEGERLLEPSAGTGVFYNNSYPKFLMYDLDPKENSIIKADFLKVDPLEFEGCFAIGNPPFGFCGKLAAKFINHCAEGCNKICMILPNTFNKELFFDKHLNRKLHLIEVLPLPKNSFILDGIEYDVPCSVFYIEKKEYDRPIATFKDYLKECNNGVYVRRVGGRAGKVVPNFTKSSTYKVTSTTDYTVSYYLDKYQDQIKLCASQTAGVRSITIDELNLIITRGENEPLGN